MKIMAIFIFREDGIPLFSKQYDLSVRNVEGLVAPFIVSASNRVEELTGSGVKRLELENDRVLIVEQFAEIMAALVVRNYHNADLKLDLIVRSFYKKYYRTLANNKWNGKLVNFDEFIPEIENFLNIDPDIAVIQVPSKILDSYVMAEFGKEAQKIIRLLIKEDEISETYLRGIFDQNLVTNTLNQLHEQGYIGSKKGKNGKTIYFN